MKKLLAIFLLIGFSTISFAGPSLARFHSRGDIFSIKAPSNWIHDKTSKFLSIYSPDERVTLNVSALKKKKGSSFSKFSKNSFVTVQRYYTPVGDVHKIKYGLVREYQGSYPGETRPSYYLVAAINRKNYYFHITLLADRENFILHKKLFLKMFESVKESAKKSG